MNAWEQSGLSPEERARAVMHAPVYGPQTLHDNITSALRAAEKAAAEREREEFVRLLESRRSHALHYDMDYAAGMLDDIANEYRTRAGGAA